MTATSTVIRDIDIGIRGDFKIDYDIAHDFSKVIAKRFNPESSLLAWHDKRKNACGPGEVCKTSSVVDLVELERYGISHGGKLRILVDDGNYMFIYN